jgi:hypothetical protein
LQKIEKEIGLRTPPENIKYNQTSTSSGTEFQRKQTNYSNNNVQVRGRSNVVNSRSSYSFSQPNTKTEDLSWENVRNFKITKMEKKEGVEKQMNDIRICLNKISAKNYDTQQEIILNYIIEMENVNKEEFEINIPKIALSIFDIASTNKFYAEVYAKLYQSLIEKHIIFESILQEYLEKYIGGLDEIKSADPNEDYDLFCLYNKENDKRKATTVFWIHMMKQKVLPKEKIVQIFHHFLDKIEEKMEETRKIHEVEEITELLFLFLQEGYSFMIGENHISLLVEEISRIRNISTYKMKEKASLSSRVIFKFMDMVTLLNKNTALKV